MAMPHPDGHRSRRLVVIVTAVLTAALVLGVALWWRQHEDKADSPRPESTRVTAFYVGGVPDSEWLYIERHSVTGSGNTLELSVNESLGTPRDPDYSPGFPEGTSATVSVEGGVATIDLRGASLEADPARESGRDGALAVQALVQTVAANASGDLKVAFTVAGAPVDVLLGQQADEPMTPTDADSVLAPVRLDMDEAAAVRQGASVGGTATAFEGTVVWRITARNSETTIEEGFTTTDECCRAMPFSITLPKLPPGTYVLYAGESDPSGGEGRPAQEDSKTFTVG